MKFKRLDWRIDPTGSPIVYGEICDAVNNYLSNFLNESSRTDECASELLGFHNVRDLNGSWTILTTNSAGMTRRGPLKMKQSGPMISRCTLKNARS